MYTPKFSGTVKEVNGKKEGVLDNPEKYKKWFRSAFDVDSKFNLEVKKYRKPRSTGKPHESGNQNGYYWAVVLPIISQYNGDNVNALHEYFIEKFLPKIEKEIFGEKILCRVRTSDLNTIEFEAYLDMIRSFMAEFGVVIPDPI